MFFEISADPDFREPAPVSVLGIREDGERENSYFAVVTNLQGDARYFWRISDGETITLRAAFKEARETKGQPTAIVMKTVKGKGVSFMENQVGWHGKAPNDEEYAIAMEELGKAGE